MWSYRYFSRIDFRVIPIILILMLMSLLIISSHSSLSQDDPFLTPLVKAQLKFFGLGIFLFILAAGFDYNKLREWAWILYALMLVALCGLFFTDAIQRVNRWYRIPLIGINFQPSEAAKLIVVIALSWFLERKKMHSLKWSTVFYAGLIVGIPFILIIKQPDLGTALVLFPITLVMFYFGDLNPKVIKIMSYVAFGFFSVISLIFLGIVSHEEIKPYALKVIKAYQFERLNPNTHHQKAAATAISLGGLTGSGFRNSEFTGAGWLPTPYTDSAFPSFGEEFGFTGLFFMMGLFYALIHCSFQVTAVAKDHFGRLLAAGITVYLAVHILINIGMMSGFFPITGVPLILISYGGTSILATMAALGILQSIYSRRFMF